MKHKTLSDERPLQLAKESASPVDCPEVALHTTANPPGIQQASEAEPAGAPAKSSGRRDRKRDEPVPERPLSREEKARLEKYVSHVKGRPRTAPEIGEALCAIADHHLYREYHLASMKAFFSSCLGWDWEGIQEGLKIMDEWRSMQKSGWTNTVPPEPQPAPAGAGSAQDPDGAIPSKHDAGGVEPPPNTEADQSSDSAPPVKKAPQHAAQGPGSPLPPEQAPPAVGRDQSSEKVVSLKISEITLDHSLQPRAGVNQDVVNDYAERMAEGDQFPPLLVFRVNDECLLVDGFHRLMATQKHGKDTVEVIVRQGTRQEAVMCVLQSNVDHGLQRSAEDKRGAASTQTQTESFVGDGAKPSSTTPPQEIEIAYGAAKGMYSVYAVAAMFPLIQGKSYDELLRSLQRDGQQEPCVVDGHTLLDGRNRVMAMNQLGLETRVIQFAELKTGLAPADWIISKNLHRRHLSDDQVLGITAKYRAWLKENASRQQADANPNQSGQGTSEAEDETSTENHTQSTEGSADADYPQKTAENTSKRKRGRPRGNRSEAEALAKQTKQSEHRARQMVKLRAESPELATAVEEGRMTLKEAIRELKARQSNSDRPQDRDDVDGIGKAVQKAVGVLTKLASTFEAAEQTTFWQQVADFVSGQPGVTDGAK